MAKKKLTRQEEFDLMKLVLDKFLWVGVALMLYGLWTIFNSTTMTQGFWIMTGGAVILLILMGILVKEYEILK